MEKLEVKNLNHHFGFTEILRDINFTLNKGEILSIVGPSGGGKTTLMHLCAGLLDGRSSIEAIAPQPLQR